MEKDEHTGRAYELFQQFIDVLNQEFHDHASTHIANLACMALHNNIVKLGFLALAQIAHSTEIRQVSDDCVQTVIILTYDLMLIPNKFPIEEPIATGSAMSKIVGPTIPKQNQYSFSIQDEAWLHSILDDIKAPQQDNNPYNQEKS